MNIEPSESTSQAPGAQDTIASNVLANDALIGSKIGQTNTNKQAAVGGQTTTDTTPGPNGQNNNAAQAKEQRNRDLQTAKTA